MKTQTVQKKLVRATKIVDASDKVLGRLAGEIVKILMGKDKTSYSMHQDVGDFVQVKNVEKLRVTGNKMTDKVYQHFSQYPGGLKTSQLKTEIEKSPARVLRRAVTRMLPRNKQRMPRMRRLIIEGEIGTKRIW